MENKIILNYKVKRIIGITESVITAKAIPAPEQPSEMRLRKANTSDTKAPFLALQLSISNGFLLSKIYDKRDDFDFDIVNFPFFGW